MIQNLTNRQKRLHWHAWHRGMRELDFLIGATADKHVKKMSEEEMDLFDHFLQADDAEVWYWITEKKPIPKEYDNIIWQWVKKERGNI